MPAEHDFTLWATYCCPPNDGEVFSDWLRRAKSEYAESLFPVDGSLEKSPER